MNDVQKEYLNDVLGSSSHLLELINSLLDLSRVESGKDRLTVSKIDLELLINCALVNFRQKAKENNIDLTLTLKPIPKTIAADQLKVTQIFYNLLGNALKFTPEGGSINVEISTEQIQNQVLISIKDSGIGIEAEYLDFIFDIFAQVEQSAARHFEGTGLGLALTKKLVERHNGNIWVESEGVDKGSTFYFTLPIRQPDHLD